MALMSKAGINDGKSRHDLVRAWTGGRTESSRDLYEKEIDDLIWKIQNDFSFTTNHARTVSALEENALRQKRSTVLAIATRCDIHDVRDFKKFNNWMKKSSIHKKRLNSYTLDELDELIKQMHKLEANYKASAEKAGTKAWHHKYGVPEVSGN